jgi:hypothetical protein
MEDQPPDCPTLSLMLPTCTANANPADEPMRGPRQLPQVSGGDTLVSTDLPDREADPEHFIE